MRIYIIRQIIHTQVNEHIEANSKEEALEKFHKIPVNELNADWEDPWIDEDEPEIDVVEE